jgi:hypothetical protein
MRTHPVPPQAADQGKGGVAAKEAAAGHICLKLSR